MARELTRGEAAVAFDGLCVGVNRFYITAGEHGVRIAFAEYDALSEKQRFAAAVLMTPELAKELGDVLTVMFAQAH